MENGKRGKWGNGLAACQGYLRPVCLFDLSVCDGHKKLSAISIVVQLLLHSALVVVLVLMLVLVVVVVTSSLTCIREHFQEVGGRLSSVYCVWFNADQLDK